MSESAAADDFRLLVERTSTASSIFADELPSPAVSKKELSLLPKEDRTKEFFAAIGGKLKYGHLPEILMFPREVLVLMQSMRARSLDVEKLGKAGGEWDFEFSSAIYRLNKTRQYGVLFSRWTQGGFNAIENSYFVGVPPTVESADIICQIHSHPGGVLFFNRSGANVDEIRLGVNLPSSSDLAYPHHKKPGLKNSDSTIVVGRNIATLTVRTKDSPQPPKGRHRDTEFWRFVELVNEIIEGAKVPDTVKGWRADAFRLIKAAEKYQSGVYVMQLHADPIQDTNYFIRINPKPRDVSEALHKIINGPKLSEVIKL